MSQCRMSSMLEERNAMMTFVDLLWDVQVWKDLQRMVEHPCVRDLMLVRSVD